MVVFEHKSIAFEVLTLIALVVGVLIVVLGLWKFGWCVVSHGSCHSFRRHVRGEAQDRKWSVDNMDIVEPEHIDIERTPDDEVGDVVVVVDA